MGGLDFSRPRRRRRAAADDHLKRLTIEITEKRAVKPNWTEEDLARAAMEARP
jgi:hypothetical protein